LLHRRLEEHVIALATVVDSIRAAAVKNRLSALKMIFKRSISVGIFRQRIEVFWDELL
jgi:hypothetical protein